MFDRAAVSDATSLSPARERGPRTLTLIDPKGGLDPGLRQLLVQRFEPVTVGEFPISSEEVRSLLPHPTLIKAERRQVGEAERLCRDIRLAGGRQPIILFSDSPTRATDRVRALRKGADEYLSNSSTPEEVVKRLEMLMERSARNTTPGGNSDRFTQTEALRSRRTNERQILLPSSTFRQAVNEHRAGENPRFSIVLLRVRSFSLTVKKHLLEFVVRNIRHREDDLIGEHREGLVIYLHGAQPGPARRVVARLLILWVGSGGSEIASLVLGYPGDGAAIAELLGAETVEDWNG